MRRGSLLAMTAPVLGVLLATLSATAVGGEEPRLGINGYDPVAYFTDRKPVPGKAEFEFLWHRLRWRFGSVAHRDLFVGDPEHYAPQYDGYCAMGVGGDTAADAHKDTVDPEAWAIVGGKLYLTHNQYWLQEWRKNAADNIRQADRDWGAVTKLPAPEIVGPPCAASPPSTKVALRGGGHWVVVAGQVARDGDGKVVGKGDLKAQIEQVGKNVDTCLATGAATVKDILFTISYVTQPAEFDKYDDLRMRYFGPPAASSFTAVVPVSRLTDPDFLVQVEAFAKTK
jgi:enamine deaminase RidA (YjgF/YER057c/UK114 family)